MWRFVQWQVFVWRYREQIHLAVMSDDSEARRLVNSEAAQRKLPQLPAGGESLIAPPVSGWLADAPRRRPGRVGRLTANGRLDGRRGRTWSGRGWGRTLRLPRTKT